VRRSRLVASAKKANTRSRGSSRLIDVLRSWSVTLLIVISLVAPLFSRLSSFLAVEYRPRLARCETAAQSVLYFLTIVEKLDQAKLSHATVIYLAGRLKDVYPKGRV